MTPDFPHEGLLGPTGDQIAREATGLDETNVVVAYATAIHGITREDIDAAFLDEDGEAEQDPMVIYDELVGRERPLVELPKGYVMFGLDNPENDERNVQWTLAPVTPEQQERIREEVRAQAEASASPGPGAG